MLVVGILNIMVAVQVIRNNVCTYFPLFLGGRVPSFHNQGLLAISFLMRHVYVISQILEQNQSAISQGAILEVLLKSLLYWTVLK